MDDDIREKLARTCDVDERAIIEAKNVETIYQVPEYFEKQGFLEYIGEKLELGKITSDLKNWNSLVTKITEVKKEVTIGIVGKYIQFEDTYKSITEAFIHAGVANDTRINLEWIDAENIKTIEEIEKKLKNVSGILIPGGFGERGVEGKILAVEYVRKNHIPFLGICLGLQVAVIESARNMCNLDDANSLEFDEKSSNLVIDLMEEQKSISAKGGTMRLGSYQAELQKGSLAEKLYGTTNITERHRHRYEVNPKYHDILEQNGLMISGKSPTRDLAEFIEIKNHPFFIATQAHPEFKSRLEKPHPLFVGLVKASLENK